MKDNMFYNNDFKFHSNGLQMTRYKVEFIDYI